MSTNSSSIRFVLLGLAVALLACSGIRAAAADAVVPAVVRQRAIMSGDRLRISVVEAPDLNRVYAVAGDGTIDFGLVGRVSVEGLSNEEVADKLSGLLEEKYFKRATVTAAVSEFVEGSIMVMGAVRKSGVIPFKGDDILTLIEVIGMCDGLAPNANGAEVRILRWKPGGGMERQIITVDVQAMLETLDFSRDQFLRPRDMIFVPTLGAGENGGEFLALGELSAAGFHPHSAGLDMIRAVARSGGVTREAKMDAARLLRQEPNGQYRVIPVDLSRLFGAADMQMNVPVMPGDILFVPSAQQSAAGKIYLLGEVNNPGILPIPLDRETTLARTILTHGGFTKFANQGKVRIQRTGPDGMRQSMDVDVGRILKSGAFDEDVPLQNEDVVIVPERMLF